MHTRSWTTDMPMQHFAVIQSLCRVGLSGNDPQFRRQVERLRDRLRKDDQMGEVATLDRLLAAATRETELTPSRVEVSRALVQGETLIDNVLPPADRETGAPLAEILMRAGDGMPDAVYP